MRVEFDRKEYHYRARLCSDVSRIAHDHDVFMTQNPSAGGSPDLGYPALPCHQCDIRPRYRKQPAADHAGDVIDHGLELGRLIQPQAGNIQNLTTVILNRKSAVKGKSVS